MAMAPRIAPLLLTLLLLSALSFTLGNDCAVSPDTIKLRDGRTLAYCEYGASADEETSTVLHSNGSGGSRLEWPGDETMLRNLGIRFIGVDRPGHGHSDPQPNGRVVIDWARVEIAQLLDHLGVDKFYVEGWSAGGCYALAIAHQFGFTGRVLGGAILSGIGPPDRPDPFLDLNPQIAQWMEFARDGDETAVRDLRKPMVELMQSFNAAAIGDMLAMPGAKGLDDIEIANRPDLKVLMGMNFKEGFRQGADGPTQDDLAINSPWGFREQDISGNVHIDIWQGEVDQNVPIHQGFYQDSIIPNSTLHIVKGNAHLFPLFQWEEILRTLVAPLPDNETGTDKAEL